MKVQRPALRYHGGKWQQAKWTISYFPEHEVYTESYGGGGSTLLQKSRSYAEIYNDRWDMVVNVFKQLRDNGPQLKELLRLTPFSRTEFNQTDAKFLKEVKDNPLELARRTIFRSFSGFGSAATNPYHTTGFRCDSTRSGTTPASDWMNLPRLLDALIERMQGVVIENADACEVMLRHDGPTTLHYVDPPYPHSTRGMRRRNAAYVFEMNDADHRVMARVLRALKGHVVLSGYPCDLYEELFGDWQRVERRCYADGARARCECLWMPRKTFNASRSLLDACA